MGNLFAGVSALRVKIRSLPEKRRSRLDLIVVILIYLFGVVLHTLLSNFSGKTIAVYLDEFLYWSIARSVAQGSGIAVEGCMAGFDKIAYPLLIAPIFAVSDGVLRVNLIGLVNSMILMSSIFPIWLICKELGLKRRNTFIILGFLAVWPDMLLSASFMSESLYWPLVLFFLYIWLLSIKQNKWYYHVIEGVLCYIGYMCKEVFMALFVTYIAFEIIYPFLDFFVTNKDCRGRLKDRFDKKRIINCLIFALSFAVCFIIVKIIVYNGDASYYKLMNTSTSLAKIAYFFYGFVYYIAAFFVTFFVLPLAFPIIRFKSFDDKNRKFSCFIVVFFLVMTAVISYKILINENLGQTSPQVYMRYYGPVIPLIFALFLICLQNRKDTDKVNSERSWLVLIVITVLSCAVFRGTHRDTAVDETLIKWYEGVCESFALVGSGQIIEPHMIFVGLIMILLVLVLFYLYTHNYESYFYKIFFAVMAATCIINNILEYKVIYFNMYADMEIISAVGEIDDYFASQDEDCVVLYITATAYSPYRRSVDTYGDNLRNLYVVKESFIFPENIPEKSIVFRDTGFPSTVEKGYIEHIDHIDYIITDEAAYCIDRQFINVEPIPGAWDEHYSLFKNLDPDTLSYVSVTDWE